MSKFQRVAIIGAVFALVAAVVAGGFVTPASAAPASGILPAKIFFPQTGHNLSGDFLTAWQANGGLMTYGYPLTEPFTENGMTVQYFERARFEEHPDQAGTRYVVQATLLGTWAARDISSTQPFKPIPTASASKPTTDRIFFPETGHYLAYGFLSYWESHGGLYVFGYPISEEFNQNGLTVQYFQRARFEWHPENKGTDYEVLLGRIGADYAAANHVNTAPVAQAPGAITAFPGLLDPAWSKAVRTADGSIVGIVTASALNIRATPHLNAAVVGQTYARHPVMIQGVVDGDSVDGVPVWYQIGPGQYLAATWVQPFVASTPPQTFTGHWVDVNLSQFIAVAYDNAQPVYAAIITAGADGKTPTGVYNVMYRVRDETMDSATVGIPKGSPGYYYLTGVQFTQYFKSGGYALHQNWWTPSADFGNYSTNGCVGFLLPDAQWLWNFLSVGSVVSLHY